MILGMCTDNRCKAARDNKCVFVKIECTKYCVFLPVYYNVLCYILVTAKRSKSSKVNYILQNMTKGTIEARHARCKQLS